MFPLAGLQVKPVHGMAGSNMEFNLRYRTSNFGTFSPLPSEIYKPSKLRKTFWPTWSQCSGKNTWGVNVHSKHGTSICVIPGRVVAVAARHDQTENGVSKRSKLLWRCYAVLRFVKHKPKGFSLGSVCQQYSEKAVDRKSQFGRENVPFGGQNAPSHFSK